MNWAEEDMKFIWHPCSQMKDYEELKPIVIDRGKGVFLYDKEGNEYIDIVSSWWCNLLGHCNPKISGAVREQLGRLEHVIFANFSHEGAIRLCQELDAVVPPGLKKYSFQDNGSASVECALKMAFQYMRQTGREKKTKFMCLTGAYHGETIGALSVGAMDMFAKIYQPMLMDSFRVQAPDCYRCPFGDCRERCSAECICFAERLFDEHAEETCALIVEPLVQGSAGMRIYPPLYLKKLRELCDRHDVLLIADEIATGFGRTGRMFACGHAEVSPDIMCLSKGLTGGYLPMSIAVTTDRIYDAFYDDYSTGKAFMHSHTYSGNPLGCAAALAVLRTLREDAVLEQAAVRAAYLTRRLEDEFCGNRHIGEIRHIGLIHALELTPDASEKSEYAPSLRIGYRVYKNALRRGLLLRPLGNVLYFNPPLVITEEELDRAVAACRSSIRDVLGD